MKSFDAIVIGAGVNGLAAAGRLALSGARVAIVEKSDHVGGAMDTVEFMPGYRASGVAHLMFMPDARVIRELELERHGFALAAEGIATTALSADGRHLRLEGAFGESIAGDLDAGDRAEWALLRARLLRQAALLAPFNAMVPPRLARGAGNDLLAIGRLAMRMRLAGREEFRELMRMLLINVADALDEGIADERLKGVIAHDAVLGSHLAPRSPNSLLLLLHRLSGTVNGRQGALGVPKGGMGGVAQAFERALHGLGVEVVTGAQASRLVVDGEAATGIVLASGETLRARMVLAATDPKTALLALAGPSMLDTGVIRRVRSIRSRGHVARLHLALSEPPDFRGADLATRLVAAPSLRAVETAFDPVKYGEVPERPVLEILVPSAFEPGMAPPGHHVLSINAMYAPVEPLGGWNKARGLFFDRVMAVLEDHAPGIGKLVVGAQLLTPRDLEDRHGLVGGDWHHGELAVERMLFLRPTVGLSQYRTPVTGYYLAGAGSHPGGGVSGAAGWNAAGVALEDGR